jgi:hypothetical protein
MPRLQILPLPDVFVGEASETPFVLVIDQVDEATADAFREDLEKAGNIAEKIGARAVLCFEDTIDIPANDISAFATGSVDDVRLDVQGDLAFPDPSGDELHDAVKRNLGSGSSLR